MLQQNLYCKKLFIDLIVLRLFLQTMEPISQKKLTNAKSQVGHWDKSHTAIPPGSKWNCLKSKHTIVRILRKLVEENGVDWDLMVQTAVFAYNISFHLVTKFSPFRLL